MDNHRFDTLVKRLSVLSSRRDGVRVLAAGLAAGFAEVATPPGVAACGRRGQLCTRDRHCCSGGCGNMRRRRFKTKKGKVRHRRVGKCACSLSQERCRTASDCCFEDQVCGPNDCQDQDVCCSAIGFPCKDNCDCCFDSFCCEECGGVCERKDCSGTQERCDATEDCCFEDEICGSIDPACDPESTKVCCGTVDAECEEDCDCCAGLECDQDDGECIAPISSCSPAQVVCPPGTIKPCCEEVFGECCPLGSVAGCCQTGFPVCCDHEHPPFGGCCPENHHCCQPEDRQLCCPNSQVCCPSGSEEVCADTLEACSSV